MLGRGNRPGLVILYTLFIALLFCAFYPATAQARSLEMDKLAIDAELLPDGSMQVTEHITVTFHGSYNGYFVSFPQDNTPITDILVSEKGSPYQFNPGESYGPPGTYLVKQEGNKLTIDWSINASDEQRTFDVSYRVNNLIKMHTDVAEFYRKFVSSDNGQKIGQVIVRLQLPAGAENLQQGTDIRIWGHGPLHGEVQFTGPREVTWQIEDMPSNKFLEGRMVLPLQLFPAAPTELSTGQAGLPIIMDEEGRWAEGANRRRQEARMQVGIAILIPILTLIALFFMWRKYGKEYQAEFQGDYYRELPADYSPAELSVLWNWGQVKTHDITATLLDLARRQYITIEQELFEKKRLLGTKEVTTYLISLRKEKYDAEREKLRPHEIDLINLIFSKISKGKPYLYLYDIEEYSKENSRGFYNFWLGWKNDLAAIGETNEWFLGTPSRIRWIAAGVALVFFLTGLILIRAEVVLPGVSIFLCSFFIAFVPAKFKRRSQPAHEDLRKWEAFKRFLLHFSNMERHEIPSLVIWEHYLVYAVTLGVAKEVMKQLEIVFPNLQEDDYRFGQYWWHSQTGFAMAGLSDNFDKISESIQHSIQVAEKTVKAAESKSSSGSGGGGGFSGGGGGGSGGGSYGGR